MEPLFLTSSLLRRPGLVHGFSTRQGGVSGGAFATLNLGYSVGDWDDAVLENHARLRQAVGAPDACWAGVRQVHGATVVRIDRTPAEMWPDAAEVPVRGWSGGDADALITDRPGWLIGVKTADCVPILLAGPGVVGAVHAGWRGTAQRIVVETVRQLQARYGVAPNDLVAAIGPAIGPECYEVGEEVVQGLSRALEASPGGTDGVILPGPPGRVEGAPQPHVDLVEANRRLLIEAGLPASSIQTIGVCVRCDDRFFSYRRDRGVTGRMLNFIGLTAA